MFIDDIKAIHETINKIYRNVRLSAPEKKAFDELKEKWGLSPEGTIKTQEALAECINVSRQTVIRWKKEGMPVEADGTYDPIRIMKWRDMVYPPNEKRAAENPDSEGVSWETEFRKYRAKLAELSFKQKLGELIPRVEVETLFVERAVEFRRALLDMGRRLSFKLAHKDTHQINAIIEAEAIDILDAYSREHELGQQQEISEEDLFDVDDNDNADDKTVGM